MIEMPNFWVTDFPRARVTLGNPSPVAIECKPYLQIGKLLWGGVPTTIPASGQVTVDIEITAATQGVGTYTVQVAVDAMDGEPLLVAPAGNLSLYALSVELVNITWGGLPDFLVTDVGTARITLGNPAPIAIECKPYLLIGEVARYWGGVSTTIPGKGQVTVGIDVSMSIQGVGTHPVQLSVRDLTNAVVLLEAPVENINIFKLSVELVDVTWE